MTTPSSLSLVLVPPTGQAGAVELADRRTQHRWTVQVAPFHLAPVPVTAQLYGQVTGRDVPAGGENLPATEVSWHEAVAFCNTLSRQHGLAPAYNVTTVKVEPVAGWAPHHRPAAADVAVTWDAGADGYRLPSEAEWELACRAGTPGPRYGDLDAIAWHSANAGDRPHPVGTKEANTWGLFDTLGGVWEWCFDHYDQDVYGPYRVLRGGGWFDEPWSCRAGVRRRSHPSLRIDDVGFRLARTIASTGS